jgi:uncharacterized protein (TIGR02271 family)
MTIADMRDPGSMTGAPVHGSDGEKLGKIDAIYCDNDTDRPEWAAVKSGLFGSHVSLVPLSSGRWDGNALTVPFDREALKTAPHHDPDTALSPDDEDDLYRHYGVSTGRPSYPAAATGRDTDGRHSTDERTEDDGRREGVRRDRTGDAGIQGHDASGPTTDDAMTRSEERLRVGTEQHDAGRARLRKHITTENVSTTVPVSHEEVTLEREPITEANRGDALAGGDLTEEEHEVTLTEQRAVTSKETVPVERVRLGTQTVTENQQVDETIRKEEIDEVEVDGATGERGRQRSPER